MTRRYAKKLKQSKAYRSLRISASPSCYLQEQSYSDIEGSSTSNSIEPACHTKCERKRNLLPSEEVKRDSDGNIVVVDNESSVMAEDCAAKNGPQPDIPSTSKMPEKSVLQLALDTIQRKDIHEFFAEPVDPKEVEDCHEIIKEPMDFGTTRAKLHEGMYTGLEQFEHDVIFFTKNAMHFNSSSGTIYFRQARAIHDLAKNVLQVLKSHPTDFDAQFYGIKRKTNKRSSGESSSSTTVPSNRRGIQDDSHDTNRTRPTNKTLHGKKSYIHASVLELIKKNKKKTRKSKLEQKGELEQVCKKSLKPGQLVLPGVQIRDEQIDNFVEIGQREQYLKRKALEEVEPGCNTVFLKKSKASTGIPLRPIAFVGSKPREGSGAGGADHAGSQGSAKESQEEDPIDVDSPNREEEDMIFMPTQMLTKKAGESPKHAGDKAAIPNHMVQPLPTAVGDEQEYPFSYCLQQLVVWAQKCQKSGVEIDRRVMLTKEKAKECTKKAKERIKKVEEKNIQLQCKQSSLQKTIEDLQKQLSVMYENRNKMQEDVIALQVTNQTLAASEKRLEARLKEAEMRCKQTEQAALEERIKLNCRLSELQVESNARGHNMLDCLSKLHKYELGEAITEATEEKVLDAYFKSEKWLKCKTDVLQEGVEAVLHDIKGQCTCKDVKWYEYDHILKPGREQEVEPIMEDEQSSEGEQGSEANVSTKPTRYAPTIKTEEPKCIDDVVEQGGYKLMLL